MRAVLVYTMSRLALLLLALGVLWLLGARGLLAVLLAVVVSGLISYVLLSAQRDAFSRVVAGRFATARQRFSEASAREDDDDWEQRPPTPS